MSSLKRELPESEEPESKRSKLAVQQEISEPNPNHRVLLNSADCNLDFNVEDNGLRGSSLHEEGFAYCWSGARATIGITGGKYCYSCKIVSIQAVTMEDTPPDQQHVCRVGISRGDGNVGSLGETENSFGFGGTGKLSNAGKFSDYGEKFGVGDTIVCAVNLESKPLATIGFSKNGKWLGVAKQFNAGSNGLGVVDCATKDLKWKSALFPHVLVKNVVFEAQFSVEEGLIPQEGYKPWSSAIEDGNSILGPRFSDIKDCEVMMMVGLPASGKSTWAEKWVKEHPEKCCVLLGTNMVMEQMKVPGLLRKNNYGERFDHLMTRATAIFNTLLSRAAKTPHNYIIDQTNVYKNARKRKLKPFADFQKIAVVVFPKPEELKLRAEKRFKDMGKEVPDEAVKEMIANYVLPTSKDIPGSDDVFDKVMFPELDRLNCERYLDEMKRSLSSTCNARVPMENLVQSYTGPLLQTQGVSSVTGGPWQNYSHPFPPPLPYQQPAQVISTLQYAEPHGTAGSFSRPHLINQNPQSRDSSFGNYLNYRSDIDPYSSHGVSGPYVSHRVNDPYMSHGVNDPYRRGGFYDANGNQIGNVAPYTSYPSERVNVYESPAANSWATLPYNAHGGSAVLPGHQPPIYGSPYVTPTQRPYANLRPDMHHSDVHSVPQRPRYF